MNQNKTDSVLITMKKVLGISSDDFSFDTDIILHINAAFFTLYQVGGIPKVVRIEGEEETFEDLVGEMTKEIDFIKMYIYHKVRLSFDPPSSATVMESLKEMIREAEWRLRTSAEIDE